MKNSHVFEKVAWICDGSNNWMDFTDNSSVHEGSGMSSQEVDT